MTAAETYPAGRLLCMAMRWLREQHPESVIVPELSVGNWGKARIDVAAICEDEIVGVEIKGDGDSPSRLSRQGWSYGLVASRVYLLPAPSLAGRCEKARPDGWGLLGVTATGCVQRQTVGAGGRMLGDAKRLDNSAAAMAGLFWADEARATWTWWLGQIPQAMRDAPWLPPAKANAVHTIHRAMGEAMPAAILRRELCRTLTARNWRRTPFGGTKTVYRPGEDLPEYTAAIAELMDAEAAE